MATMRPPPRRRSSQTRLADQAYEFVKDGLLSGAFGQGEKISVEKIVKQLDTSRQPAMEAMKRLASDGFIEIIPQVGCRVVVPEPREVGDFYRLFAPAEALCAELAAERASEEGLFALRTAYDQIDRLIATPMAKEQKARLYRGLNRNFHAALHAMTRSPLITEIASGLWDRSDFYIATAIGQDLFSARLEMAQKEHAAVIKAVEKGDPKRAHQAMVKHVTAFGNRILRQARQRK